MDTIIKDIKTLDISADSASAYSSDNFYDRSAHEISDQTFHSTPISSPIRNLTKYPSKYNNIRSYNFSGGVRINIKPSKYNNITSYNFTGGIRKHIKPSKHNNIRSYNFSGIRYHIKPRTTTLIYNGSFFIIPPFNDITPITKLHQTFLKRCILTVLNNNNNHSKIEEI